MFTVAVHATIQDRALLHEVEHMIVHIHFEVQEFVFSLISRHMTSNQKFLPLA